MGQKTDIHTTIFKVSSILLPLGYQYPECIVDTLRVHYSRLILGIHWCQPRFKFYGYVYSLQTLILCSQILGNIPTKISTGNNSTLFVPATSLSSTLYTAMRIWKDSTLTLFQVQISFAVFPDSKLDSGKKKVFHILAIVLQPREKYTPWYQYLSQDIQLHITNWQTILFCHVAWSQWRKKKKRKKRRLFIYSWNMSDRYQTYFHLPLNLYTTNACDVSLFFPIIVPIYYPDTFLSVQHCFQSFWRFFRWFARK